MKIATPAEADKFIKELQSLRGCARCGEPFSVCRCEPPKGRDRISTIRPWGYKGSMVLPRTHPDHPEHGK